MIIDLGSLEWVARLAGVPFPEADEDALWRCARAWYTAADQLRRLPSTAQEIGDRLAEAVEGAAATRLGETWAVMGAPDGVFQRLADQCDLVGGVCERAAEQVEHTKLVILAELAALATVAVGLGAGVPGLAPTRGLVVAQALATARLMASAQMARLAHVLGQPIQVPDDVEGLLDQIPDGLDLDAPGGGDSSRSTDRPGIDTSPVSLGRNPSASDPAPAVDELTRQHLSRLRRSDPGGSAETSLASDVDGRPVGEPPRPPVAPAAPPPGPAHEAPAPAPASPPPGAAPAPSTAPPSLTTPGPGGPPSPRGGAVAPGGGPAPGPAPSGPRPGSIPPFSAPPGPTPPPFSNQPPSIGSPPGPLPGGPPSPVGGSPPGPGGAPPGGPVGAPFGFPPGASVAGGYGVAGWGPYAAGPMAAVVGLAPASARTSATGSPGRPPAPREGRDHGDPEDAWVRDDEALALARACLFATDAGYGFYPPGDAHRARARAVAPVEGRVAIDVLSDPDGFTIDTGRFTPLQFAGVLRELIGSGEITVRAGECLWLVTGEAGSGSTPAAATLARQLGIDVVGPDGSVFPAADPDRPADERRVGEADGGAAGQVAMVAGEVTDGRPERPSPRPANP